VVERPLAESPGLATATSVVGRYEIEQIKPYSVVDAMKYLPGAWTETRGRKIKQFYSVRGQRYPYPGYLIDGAWFREMHEVTYYLNAADVDRIEVLRSSAALMSGPGGMTGMVNIVPRTYEQQETNLEGLYGSYNTGYGHVGHGKTGDRYTYALGAGTVHTDGKEDKNARENMSNLFGRIQFHPREDLTLTWSNFYLYGDRQLKLAEAPATSLLQTRKESFDPMHSYITVGKARFQPTDRAATDLILNFGDRRFDGHREGSADWMEEETEYGVNLMHSHRLVEANTLRFGAMTNRWYTTTGKRYYVGNPADLRTYSGVVVDDHDFGRLDTSLGYRLTSNHIKEFGGYSVEGQAGALTNVRVYDEWVDPMHTLNAGAAYELTEPTALLGNFAWGTLAPEPGMLDSNLQPPGTETRYKLDAGVRRRHRWGEATLTGFYVYQDDAALPIRQTVTGPDGLPYALFENGDRENVGLELEIKSRRFQNGLQGFINLTGMKTRRTRGGAWEDDTEIPDFLVGGGLSYLWQNLETHLFVHHVSAYENDRFLPSGTPAAPLGDYIELNGVVSYHFDRDLDVYVKVDNFTDEHYSTVNGYPDDGIRVFGGLVKRFR
jgi:outer membrane receptor protein involved in Fe transport